MAAIDERYVLNKAREQARNRNYETALKTISGCTSERAVELRVKLESAIRTKSIERNKTARNKVLFAIATAIILGLFFIVVTEIVAQINLRQIEAVQRSQQGVVESNQPSISYTDALTYCRGRMSNPDSERSRTIYIPQCIERVQTYGFDVEPTDLPGLTLEP